MQNENEPHVRLNCGTGRGNTVHSHQKNKSERIIDTLGDLRLAIDGLRMQQAQRNRRHSVQSLSAFARTCSIFLRKLVLGDHDRRGTRLLDDAMMASLKIRLQGLRKILPERRRSLQTGWSLSRGSLQITKIDEPGPVLPTYRFDMPKQGVEFKLWWPIPGFADWIEPPTLSKPWMLAADQLFDVTSDHSMTCDNWLAQQVLIFDHTPVSLKRIVRDVATFEGAHALNMGASNARGGQHSRKKGNIAPLHLLNGITIFGVPLPHIIVIETALYLFEQLLREPSIEQHIAEPYSFRLDFSCTPEQATSSQPDWLQFHGGQTLVFSSQPNEVRHKIKAPNR